MSLTHKKLNQTQTKSNDVRNKETHTTPDYSQMNPSKALINYNLTISKPRINKQTIQGDNKHNDKLSNDNNNNQFYNNFNNDQFLTWHIDSLFEYNDNTFSNKARFKFNILEESRLELAAFFAFANNETLLNNGILIAPKLSQNAFGALMEMGNYALVEDVFDSFKPSMFHFLSEGRIAKVRTDKFKAFNDVNLSGNDTLKVDISGLKLSDFRPFYLVDIFHEDGSCTHGSMVYDVVKQLLKTYNLDFSLQKVHEIPINYFTNRRIPDSIGNVWSGMIGREPGINSYMSDSGKFVSHSLFEKFKFSDENTPEEYLTAIYLLYGVERPDIISSSFEAACARQVTLGTFSKKNRQTNFLVSASNRTVPIEEYIEIDAQDKEMPTVLEPISTYMQNRKDYATAIVSNQTATDSVEGNFSNTGENVTVVGNGTHWGLLNVTKCITDSISGTSFATPEVATKLFIAKAYWRSVNDSVDAFEARQRLILATNLNSKYIGKFASAGTVNINKLLQYGKGYLVRNDDSIIGIDSLGSGVIVYNDGNGDIVRKFGEQGNRNIKALYYETSKAYMFSDSQRPCWMPINGINLFVLNVKRRDGEMLSINSFQEFVQNFKQVVIFK